MLSGLLLIAAPVAQATDGVSIGTGANYSIGNYGTSARDHKVSDHLCWQGHAHGGMTNGSPDRGVSTSINYTF